MRRYIDNRPEIGDTLTLRPLIRKLQACGDEVVVREDRHGLLSDLNVKISDRCCVICGETAYEPMADTPYFRCEACDFWYQHPVPTPRWECRTIENTGHLMTDVDKAANQYIAEMLHATYSPRSVMDVGSKYPYLLHCLKKLGVKHVHGIDGCEKAIEYGDQLGVRMTNGDFLAYTRDRLYDMLTMIHLVEHVADPRQLLRKAKQVLKPGGLLIIRTPIGAHTFEEAVKQRKGNKLRDFTPSHYEIHPVLFSAHALLQLLSEEGFEIVLSKMVGDCGQIDVHAKFVEDTRSDYVLHQWTNKHDHGDYLRRAKHFYQFPLSVAEELGWLESNEIPKLDLPPLPDVSQFNLPARYAVIAAECGGVARNWPRDRWMRVIEWLRKSDVEIVTVGTTRLVAEGVTDLCGKTTVLQSAAVIKGAILTVSADTAAAHMSSALDVPTVALMGPADAALTFADNVNIVYRTDGGCTKCYHALKDNKPYGIGQQLPLHPNCDWHNSDCMANVGVGQVIDTIADVLNIDQHHSGLLSVCIMVKNEDHNIGPALESALAVADEFVVVDTGSTDDTKQVVEQTLAGKDYKLLDYDPGDPIKSFSEVRNFAFQHATCRYVMWLDAGDRLTSAEELRSAVALQHYDSYSLQTLYGAPFWRERVVLRCFAEFVDDVHETMRIDGLSSVRLNNTAVSHLWTEKKGREQSLERNTRLLKGMIDREGPAHPRYSRWVYYYARDLLQLGKKDEALEQFAHRMQLGGFWEEQALAALAIARVHMEAHRYVPAIRAAYDAMKFCDGWRDPYYIVGDAYYWLGNYKVAIQWFEHCLKIDRPTAVLGAREDLYTWLPQCQLSYCYEKLGQYGTALHWAVREQKNAPTAQKARISGRIQELAARMSMR